MDLCQKPKPSQPLVTPVSAVSDTLVPDAPIKTYPKFQYPIVGSPGAICCKQAAPIGKYKIGKQLGPARALRYRPCNRQPVAHEHQPQVFCHRQQSKLQGFLQAQRTWMKSKVAQIRGCSAPRLSCIV